MDSDFDVDEANWGPDDKAEEKILQEEKKKKKKQWVKPFKQPVWSRQTSAHPINVLYNQSSIYIERASQHRHLCS